MTISAPGQTPLFPSTAGRGAFVAQLVLGLLGPVVLFSLMVQFFEVYATFGPDPLQATPSDGVRYLWTAGLGVALAVGSIVLAIVRRRVIAFLAAVALLVGVLGTAYVLAVPHGRWTPAPESNQLPADYVPCFSGSGTCVGG